MNSETFTVKLGTQIKFMHNLRLFSGSWSDLIPLLSTDDFDFSASRIETLSTLYSSKLKALVVTLTPEQFKTYHEGRVNQSKAFLI